VIPEMVARLLNWLARRMGLWRLLALLLLLVSLGSLVVELADAIRGLNFWSLAAVVVIGMLLGWGFAALNLRGWMAAVLIAVLGFVGVLVRVGRLGGELLTLLRALVILAWNSFRWLQGGPLPDWVPAVLALTELWADLSTLLARVYAWALALVAGEPSSDPVAVVFMWVLGLWMVGAWAGWMVRRRNQPLLALAPAGALLAITLSRAGGGPYVLLIPLGAALLMLACIGYEIQLNRWRSASVDYPDLGFDIATTAIFLSLLLVAAAAVSPSISVQKMIEFARRLGDRVADVQATAEPVGADQPYEFMERDALDSLHAPGLPRRHLVGSGPELSERVVMIISTGDLPPGPPDVVMRHQSLPQYYWRSHTYDRYAFYGWFTGKTNTIEYAAGEPAITATLPAQRTVRQEVEVLGGTGGLIYTAGELVAVDQGYRVAWRSGDDFFGAMVEATQYRVDSLVTEVGEDQLKAAGSDYPDWVEVRYLDLPATVPERVLALARDLTATEPTPYARARAIETHLRQIPYTLDVPEPPRDPDLDIVDYFLFDLQKGYCDYYATAMVVLARAAGLPARLAVGYASGHYNSFSAHYVVTEADAHAWVEIYFPGYGWIEFEPTGGLPPIERPGESPSFEWHEPEGSLQPSAEWSKVARYLWLALPGGLALFALVGVVWLVVEGWWLRRLKPVAAMAALYGRLRRSGRRLAVPMRAGDTPHEFATAFADRVAGLAAGGRWGRALSPAAQESRRLTELYVRASYTFHAPDAGEQKRAIKTWRRLRWRLWLVRRWQRRGD